MKKLVFDCAPLNYMEGQVRGYRLEPCSEREALCGPLKSYVDDLDLCIRFGLPYKNNGEPIIDKDCRIFVVMKDSRGVGYFFRFIPVYVEQLKGRLNYELILN
jgi:hypothetical protein